jgi:CCR4-NOT transcription complex subunit 7/8
MPHIRGNFSNPFNTHFPQAQHQQPQHYGQHQGNNYQSQHFGGHPGFTPAQQNGGHMSSMINNPGLNGNIGGGGFGGTNLAATGGAGLASQEAQMRFAHGAALQQQQARIRDVYANNLNQEMTIIRELVRKYPYVSMVSRS